MKHWKTRSKVTVAATLLVMGLGADQLAAQAVFEFQASDTAAAEHQPFSASVSVAETAVQSGSASISDVASLEVKAGPYTLDLMAATNAEVGPQPTNQSLQFSTAGDRITGFSQTWPHNPNIWVLAEDDFTSPTGDRDHVVFLAPDSIRFETVTGGPAFPDGEGTAVSIVHGEWLRQGGGPDGWFLCVPLLECEGPAFPCIPVPICLGIWILLLVVLLLAIWARR